MFKSLRKQYKNEELAFLTVRKHYAQLDHMSDEEILLYLECNSRTEIVHLATQLKQSKIKAKGISSTSHTNCTCLDAKGNSKNLYADEAEAKRMSKLLSKEQNIVLSVYVCPSNDGWHLTKR